MRIVIETIPMSEQPYNTCGDWRWDGDTLNVKVSKMSDNKAWDYAEMIVGIHEVIEALMCKVNGVSTETVDKFDQDPKYIKECEELDIEPGDHPMAPYKVEHLFATGVEKLLCVGLDIDWYAYENRLIEMTEEYDEQ